MKLPGLLVLTGIAGFLVPEIGKKKGIEQEIERWECVFLKWKFGFCTEEEKGSRESCSFGKKAAEEEQTKRSKAIASFGYDCEVRTLNPLKQRARDCAVYRE